MENDEECAVPEPGHYEIRVEGRLDGEEWSQWFDGARVECTPGRTTLRLPIRDSSMLYGVLARLRDLGITLVSVQAVRTGSHESEGGS